jgi:GNAT superfamily N-acetyltransferase
MHVEHASTKEWRALAGFHYRTHRIPPPRKIFALKRVEELCGVIVYTYPPSICFGRTLMLPKTGMKELNQKLSNISRVVVHPKYRTIGLGSKLVRETLQLAGTECVEMSAVMAKYNPFAEKAGMCKVAIQKPPKEILKIRGVLEELGFKIQFLSSVKAVSEKLANLCDNEILKVREAFLKSRHPRFSKSFSSDLPFGTKAVYEKQIRTASLEKLAELIRTCAFLLQSKVYLFWGKGHNTR